jgi:hypothetical protein
MLSTPISVLGGWPTVSSIGFVRQWPRSHDERDIDGHDSGYKLWVTENRGDRGKSREAIMLKRSILTAIPDIEGRDFHPLLAQVGKDVIEGEVTLGFEDSLSGMTS